MIEYEKTIEDVLEFLKAAQNDEELMKEILMKLAKVVEKDVKKDAILTMNLMHCGHPAMKTSDWRLAIKLQQAYKDCEVLYLPVDGLEVDQETAQYIMDAEKRVEKRLAEKEKSRDKTMVGTKRKNAGGCI